MASFKMYALINMLIVKLSLRMTTRPRPVEQRLPSHDARQDSFCGQMGKPWTRLWPTMRVPHWRQMGDRKSTV